MLCDTVLRSTMLRSVLFFCHHDTVVLSTSIHAVAGIVYMGLYFVSSLVSLDYTVRLRATVRTGVQSTLGKKKKKGTHELVV